MHLALALILALNTTQLMREGDVPGVAIVRIHDGRIQSHRSFGVANAETRQPLRDDAVFETASLTKPVFAYAVMKLVDAGVLALDVPLSRYLDEPLPDERMKRITARMVLSHTTGLQNEVMPGETLQLDFEPGERFRYSGAGYLYLARVVEHLTQKPLPVLMRELVFDPLRMQSATYTWRDELEQKEVFGHKSSGAVAARRKPTEATLPMLHVTALDYAKFVVAVMKDPRGMLAPQVEVAPSLSWGLGWALERTKRGQAFWHWGENNGEFQNFVMAYPDSGDALVVFTNSGNGFSIMPDLVANVFPGEHPAFAFMHYDHYDAPVRVFWRDVAKRGAESALKTPLAKQLDERQLNRIGYDLLSLKRANEAVTMLREVVARYPDSFNAYDSLGEAYAAAGDRANAIANYERSLALNPKNTNAVEMLKQLQP
ncbi:MAG TPA: serine hydrolase [Thermoanaerobaculia bacterium]|nr:serine hydrolase [Thermoanaerobaculia bacterium]